MSEVAEKNKALVLMEMYGIAQGLRKAGDHLMKDATALFVQGRDVEAKCVRGLAETMLERAEQAIDEYHAQKTKWAGVLP